MKLKSGIISGPRFTKALAAIEADQKASLATFAKPKLSKVEVFAAKIGKIIEVGLYLEQQNQGSAAMFSGGRNL